MNLALRDMRILGKITLVIQKQMKLHRPLGPTKLRPVKQTRTQLDHRRVKTHQLVLEPKLPLPDKLSPASTSSGKIFRQLILPRSELF